jgi:hypothetical protein
MLRVSNGLMVLRGFERERRQRGRAELGHALKQRPFLLFQLLITRAFLELPAGLWLFLLIEAAVQSSR